MKRRPLVASLVSPLAAILILAAGCREQSPTATHLEPTAAAAAGVGTPVTALKARYRAGYFSRTIGPDGGVLPFRIGTLTVPPGALSQRIEITAFVNGEDLAVEFEPHGLEFRPGYEPTLAIDYHDVQLSGSTVHIQYVNTWMVLQESLNTAVDSVATIARAQIKHFSIYCLAE